MTTDPSLFQPLLSFYLNFIVSIFQQAPLKKTARIKIILNRIVILYVSVNSSFSGYTIFIRPCLMNM